MPTRTTLLEFNMGVEGSESSTIDCVRDALLQHKFTQVQKLSTKVGFFLLFMRQDGSHATARSHPSGTVTMDIHEFVAENSTPYFTKEIVNKLETTISDGLRCNNFKSFPAVERGAVLNRYYPTTDGRMVEYDFDSVVYEADSQYQNIKIMHSKQYGNILILDNDVNLGESDLSYTRAITGHDRHDYTDKTVLILGGGDGGILDYLRKQNPKDIIMVDIDGMVIEAAKKHLRGICHDSLDQLKGDNYQVLVEDCVPRLQQFIAEGRMFDFVINDLTAIPVTTHPVGDHWEFLRLILDLSMKVLSPTGSYFTQGNGANVTGALAMYEQQLAKLQSPVGFNKELVHVPAYMEAWIFYHIWKKPSAENDSIPSSTTHNGVKTS